MQGVAGLKQPRSSSYFVPGFVAWFAAKGDKEPDLQAHLQVSPQLLTFPVRCRLQLYNP